MTHMKKSLLSIALFVCGLLLWKPVQAEAAIQVDNLGTDGEFQRGRC